MRARSVSGAVLTAMVATGVAAQPRPAPPSFAAVVQKAESAVVRIVTPGHAEEEPEPDTVQGVIRRFAGEGTMERRLLGSGFVVSPEGEIVTTWHAVAGAERVRVLLPNESEYDARIVGSDEQTDVALLRIAAPAPLPVLAFAPPGTVTVGDWVVALGNGLGPGPGAAAGIVSGKGRFLGIGPGDDLLQTDIAMSPGSSGGPLLDFDGGVVGVCTGVDDPVAAPVGMGFALPTTLVRWVLDQLREHGRVRRGWIGVTVQPVTPELARTFRLEAAVGALVTEVADGSPAARAGVRRGDVIMRVDGHPIWRARELGTWVAGATPGSTLSLETVRDGHDRGVETAVAEEPRSTAPAEPVAESGPEADWGMYVRPATAAEAKAVGLKVGTGVVVADVEVDSAAEEGGLEPGDVILQANKQTVSKVADLRRALGTNDAHALLLVRRGTAALFVELDR